jgi:hypothetical protein
LTKVKGRPQPQGVNFPWPATPYPKLKRSRRVRPRLHATRPRLANPTTNLRLQGIAAALATLAREHGEPDFAMMVLTSMDLSIPDLERAGADPYDLEPLKAASPDFARSRG